MTNLFSRWRKRTALESVLWFKSELFPGVHYGIRTVSLDQRIELSARTRELTLRHEFLKASSFSDQLEAARADLLVQKLYLQWAVVEIKGLSIDGRPASVDALVEGGPVSLADEISRTIASQMELSDTERKNF